MSTTLDQLQNLLETRKQAIDNAMVRTFDEACPASHFTVLRQLMQDQEKLLLWFAAQEVTQSGDVNPRSQPNTPRLEQPIKRAGSAFPSILSITGAILLIVAMLVSKLNITSPSPALSTVHQLAVDKSGPTPPCILGILSSLDEPATIPPPIRCVNDVAHLTNDLLEQDR